MEAQVRTLAVGYLACRCHCQQRCQSAVGVEAASRRGTRATREVYVLRVTHGKEHAPAEAAGRQVKVAAHLARSGSNLGRMNTRRQQMPWRTRGQLPALIGCVRD